MQADQESARRQYSLRRLFVGLTLFACLLGSVRLVGSNSLVYFGWGIGVVAATMLTARYTREAHYVEQAVIAILAAGLGSMAGTFCGVLFVTLVVDPDSEAAPSFNVVDSAGYSAMAASVGGGFAAIFASMGALVSTRVSSWLDVEESNGGDQENSSFGWHVAVILAVLITLGWLLIVVANVLWT